MIEINCVRKKLCKKCQNPSLNCIDTNLKKIDLIFLRITDK